ncbi:VOC family protein [Rubellimicrobium rubrum]|uniref:VOC family protein n=1 Tax=Rubellimicrobium rubrum TaxID=2585369 RepID=A0A5C4N324_9RHOB|nr:VOC family protein [Rubellimicrobium rubrum]TNC52746.1 VOC family protein [Rubellimicrobium rubrum]
MDRLSPDDHILRPVETLDRARTFLRDRLGLTELLSRPGLACFDMAGVRLILRETGRREAADTLYFGVADIFAACESLTAHGVHFPEPPHLAERRPDGSEVWVAFFTDDEARPLALHAVMAPKGRLH